MQNRLIELEIKFSQQEDLLDELNFSVYRQQQQIDLLQAQLRLLYRQVLSGAEGSENLRSADPADASVNSLRDEIPPHY